MVVICRNVLAASIAAIVIFISHYNLSPIRAERKKAVATGLSKINGAHEYD